MNSTSFPQQSAYHHLLLCAALVLTPLIGSVPIWILSLFVGLSAWRYLINHHGWYHPGRLPRLAMMLTLLSLVLLHYGTVFGRDAGIALLISLLGLKSLELRTQRDYVISVLLLYLLIMGNFLYSQSLLSAGYMLLAFLACTISLIHFNHPQTADIRYRLQLATGLLLKALPLMLVMYFLFPRLPGGLWSLPSASGAGVTGMSDEMRPGSINQLTQSDAVVFRARFEGPMPPASLRYWRVIVLWQTDGKRWSQGNLMGLPMGELIQRDSTISYQLIQEPSAKRWMYALDLPTNQPPDSRRLPGFVLQHRSLPTQRSTYRLHSSLSYRTRALSPLEKQFSLALPPTTSARVRKLALSWAQASEAPVDVVRTALTYIRQNDFHYTLSPPKLGDDPVDEFLFETRQGFCEHYSAAFTTLMRAAGIPSRVVLGYQGGEANEQGNFLLVRQADAHAWSEVWLAPQGWVRIDPTSAVAPERIEYGIDAVRRLTNQGLALGQLSDDSLMQALRRGWLEANAFRVRQTWDAMNLAWFRWVSDFGPERQEAFLRLIGLGNSSWLTKIVGLITSLLLLFALIAALGRLRRRVRDPVQRWYLCYCDKLDKIGLRRGIDEGPWNYGLRVSRERPDLAPIVERITQLYIALRYTDGKTSAGLQQLRDSVRGFRVGRA